MSQPFEFTTRSSAHAFLAGLSLGDRLSVVAGSRGQDVAVQRVLRPMDGNGFGSPDHSAVTVGFGPGRWNIEVTPAALVDGRVIIESLERADVPA